jgi:hypothetical protein
MEKTGTKSASGAKWPSRWSGNRAGAESSGKMMNELPKRELHARTATEQELAESDCRGWERKLAGTRNRHRKPEQQKSAPCRADQGREQENTAAGKSAAPRTEENHS